MANEFTDVLIKDSYARVVQVVSGSYYDGLGNLLLNFPTTSSAVSNYTIVSESYTLTSTDSIVEVLVSAVTQSLPTAAGIRGTEYSIINCSTGSIMILASGSETIGNNSLTNDTYLIVFPEDAPRIVSNNTNWRLI